MQPETFDLSTAQEAFQRDGIVRLPACAPTLRWAEAALSLARRRMMDPAVHAAGVRCEGTWFAGVDLLENGPDGRVGDVPFAGPGPELVATLGLTPDAWHAAQVSVTYPGYPRPKEGESAGAARFRLTRDAAHVDGLLPEGPDRRRYLREPHIFILGIALTESDPEAAPLVVWPGSHHAMGEAFRAARTLAGEGPADAIDLTAAYQSARRGVFDVHDRTPMPLRRGEAVLLNRHMVHGIAPWRAPDAEGRAVAYFRPQYQEAEPWFAEGTAPPI